MFKKLLPMILAVTCLTLIWAVAAPAVWANDFSHGRDCATASLLPLGTEESTVLANASDRAVYRVVLERRGLLDVRANFANSDANVELLDSECSPIGAVGGGTSVITGKNMSVTIPSSLWTLGPGAYFVRFDNPSIKAMSSPLTFAAVFTAHYGHDFATAEPMAPSTTIDSELLYPEDREVFRVDLAEAGQIHAWTMGVGPYVELYSANGSASIDMEPVAEPDTGLASPTLPPGTYYLSVRPEPNKLGPFSLTVEFDGVPNIDYEYSDVPL